MTEFPVLLYTTPEGAVRVNAVLKDEKRMSSLERSGVYRTLYLEHSAEEIFPGNDLRQFCSTTDDMIRFRRR